MLSLSVIICTKDRPNDLRECVVSILNGKRLPEEIVIIDDGNLDPSYIENMVISSHIHFQYRKKSIPNVNASRNLASSIATGDILSFLDDDVILDPNYYMSVMRAFEEDIEQRVAGITGAIKVNTHPLKRVYLRVFGLESSRPGKVQASGAVTLVRAGEIDQIIRVDWLAGCNMNFRHWVLDRYKFNEQDSGYIWGDDRDFTYPLGRKYTLIALPDAIVIHKKSPVSRIDARKLGQMEIFNLGRFFITHLDQNVTNWFALSWAFVGILTKNILNALVLHNRSSGIHQFLGNIEGLLQFIAFLRKKE